MNSNVVVFDFFGVICSEIAPFWLLKYVSENDAKQIKSKVVHAADVGEISQKEMFQKLGEIVKIPSKQVEKEWWSYVEIDYQVVELIHILRANYPIALLTNSPAQFVQEILGKHNLSPLFDPIIISSEEGCAKPNLEIYKRMLERLSVKAENTLMIDDNPINITGALNAGMQGLVFESVIKLRKALTDQNYLADN
jgi:putative hydrolase of the HAD superfamily